MISGKSSRDVVNTVALGVKEHEKPEWNFNALKISISEAKKILIACATDAKKRNFIKPDITRVDRRDRIYNHDTDGSLITSRLNAITGEFCAWLVEVFLPGVGFSDEEIKSRPPRLPTVAEIDGIASGLLPSSAEYKELMAKYKPIKDEQERIDKHCATEQAFRVYVNGLGTDYKLGHYGILLLAQERGQTLRIWQIVGDKEFELLDETVSLRKGAEVMHLFYAGDSRYDALDPRDYPQLNSPKIHKYESYRGEILGQDVPIILRSSDELQSDYAFVNLAGSRERFVDTLLALKDDVKARKKLVPEIFQALAVGRMDTMSLADRDIWDANYTYRQTISMDIAWLERQFFARYSKLKSSDYPDKLSKIRLFAEYGANADDLSSLYEQESKYIEILCIYCEQKTIFEAYLNQMRFPALLTGINLGFNSAMLYAELSKINIYLWGKSPTDSQQLIAKQIIYNSAKAKKAKSVHVLDSKSFIQFNVLVASNANAMDAEFVMAKSMEMALTKLPEPVKQEIVVRDSSPRFSEHTKMLEEITDIQEYFSTEKKKAIHGAGVGSEKPEIDLPILPPYTPDKIKELMLYAVRADNVELLKVCIGRSNHVELRKQYQTEYVQAMQQAWHDHISLNWIDFLEVTYKERGTTLGELDEASLTSIFNDEFAAFEKLAVLELDTYFGRTSQSAVQIEEIADKVLDEFKAKAKISPSNMLKIHKDCKGNVVKILEYIAKNKKIYTTTFESSKKNLGNVQHPDKRVDQYFLNLLADKDYKIDKILPVSGVRHDGEELDMVKHLKGISTTSIDSSINDNWKNTILHMAILFDARNVAKYLIDRALFAEQIAHDSTQSTFSPVRHSISSSHQHGQTFSSLFKTQNLFGQTPVDLLNRYMRVATWRDLILLKYSDIWNKDKNKVSATMANEQVKERFINDFGHDSKFYDYVTKGEVYLAAARDLINEVGRHVSRYREKEIPALMPYLSTKELSLSQRMNNNIYWLFHGGVSLHEVAEHRDKHSKAIFGIVSSVPKTARLESRDVSTLSNEETCILLKKADLLRITRDEMCADTGMTPGRLEYCVNIRDERLLNFLNVDVRTGQEALLTVALAAYPRDEHGYLSKPESVQSTLGMLESIKSTKTQSIVVTVYQNDSAIAHGLARVKKLEEEIVTLKAEARAEIGRVRATANDKLVKARAEIAKAQAETAKAQAETAKAQAEAAVARTEVTEARAEVTEARAEAAEARTAAEEARTETIEARVETARVKVEIEQLQKDKEAESIKLAKAQADAETAQTEAANAQAAIAKADARVTSLEAAVAMLLAERNARISAENSSNAGAGAISEEDKKVAVEMPGEARAFIRDVCGTSLEKASQIEPAID